MSLREIVSVRNRSRENAASKPNALPIELNPPVFSNMKARRNTIKLRRKKVKKESLFW
jgi:hypothetical protein